MRTGLVETVLWCRGVVKRPMKPILMILVLALVGNYFIQANRADKPRPPRKILEEFHAVEMPVFCEDTDPEAIAAFEEAIRKGCRQQADLAWELYEGHPKNPKVPELLQVRWAVMSNALDEASEVLSETRSVLQNERQRSILVEARMAAAWAGLQLKSVAREEKMALIEEAIRAEPKNERGGYFLMEVAKYHTADPKQMKALVGRVLKGWRAHRSCTGEARRLMKLLARIGQPMEFSFEDVLTARPVDTADWKGTPVLVHVARGPGYEVASEIEVMKAMLARHRNLHIVSVYRRICLDEREALIGHLQKNGIDWPVYHTEKLYKEFWKDPWFVGQKPSYFLLDGEGKITSVGHRAAMMAAWLDAGWPTGLDETSDVKRHYRISVR